MFRMVFDFGLLYDVIVGYDLKDFIFFIDVWLLFVEVVCEGVCGDVFKGFKVGVICELFDSGF